MSIKKRQVFYIPGYEPSGPVFYEKLFLKHLVRYCRMAKSVLTSRQSSVTSLSRTTVCHFDDHQSCEQLTYDILDNASVLQPHSDIPRWKFYWLMIILTPKAFISVIQPNIRNVDYGPLVAIFPWLTFYLALFLILGIAFATQTALSLAHLPNTISLGVSIVVAVLLFRLFDQQHKKHNLTRVFNSGRFFIDPKDPIQKNMSRRLEEFADFIESEILKGKADEYVVVGHSSGSVLAARVAAILARSERLKDKQLDLVCMGSVYQLELCGQTHVNARTEVYHQVRDAENIHWTEVFSAFDAFCPQRMDPCDSLLTPNPDSKESPYFRSANFRKNLSAAKLKRLRKNLMWIHMQYILSSDKAETFDYFQLLTSKVPVFDYLRQPKAKG